MSLKEHISKHKTFCQFSNCCVFNLFFKVVKSHFQWFKLAPLIFCWGIGVCSSACDLKLLEPIIHIEACQKVIFGCVSPSILFTSCHYSSHFLFKSLVTFCQLVNKNVFAAKSSSSSLTLKCNAHRIFSLL